MKLWWRFINCMKQKQYWHLRDITISAHFQYTTIQQNSLVCHNSLWQRYPCTCAAVFQLKSHFTWRKSATKFLCVKTVSDKVVRHPLAYLSVRKWLMGDVPFYVKFWRILTHPRAIRRCSIYFWTKNLINETEVTTVIRRVVTYSNSLTRRLAVARPCDCSYSIFARSASAVAASKKDLSPINTTIGSPVHTFQWAKMNNTRWP